MEEFKEDLRIVRTRKLLCNALFSLLETEPFEKISVMGICKEAMVHRATFYNHFSDKEELLEYAIDEIKENLFAATVEKESYTSSKEMYMSLTSTVVEFVEQNKPKILLIINKNSYEKVYELLLTTVKRSIAYLTSKNKYKEDYALPLNVLIDFISGGITSVGLSWLQAKNPCSKEELIEYFNIILDKRIFVK